jgi:hypothetical protein
MNIGEAFKPLIIRKYQYWTLVLHGDQLPYVGRTYAWWVDRQEGEGERMAPWELPLDALKELYGEIVLDVMKGLTALGHRTMPYGDEFLLNMPYLANELDHHHHMHVHMIPRFKEPLVIEKFGIQSVDERWGKNYLQPKDTPQPPAKVLEDIRSVMSKAATPKPHLFVQQRVRRA